MTNVNHEAVGKFVRGNLDLLGSLWGRWQDEKEYEDVNEYGARIAKEFPEGWTLVKTTKRPFGVVIQIGEEHHQVKVTGAGTRWKRIK
jgi:hypothetical protein